MADWDDDRNYRGSASEYVEKFDEDTAPDYESLEDFAAQAPTEGWVDLGAAHGGHEFVRYGQVRFADDPNNVWDEIHFHVHPEGAQGVGNAVFGGMWVTGQTGSGRNLNYTNISLQGLAGIARQFGYDSVLPSG